MKIVLTAQEMLDKGIWDEFCELRGINIWAINEGLMDSDEELTFNEEEIKELKLT